AHCACGQGVVRQVEAEVRSLPGPQPAPKPGAAATMMRSATLFFGIACALTFFAGPCPAQPAHLEKTLLSETKKADERKGAVQQLAEREKALTGKLGEIDTRMKVAQARILKQEEALDVIR